jgi:hypothetical protein
MELLTALAGATILLVNDNPANQLVDAVRTVEPRGNADCKTQTAQALRAFVHEVSAQEGTHIDAATATALIDQANMLITDLEGTKPPTVGETAQAIDTLRSAVTLDRRRGPDQRQRHVHQPASQTGPRRRCQRPARPRAARHALRLRPERQPRAPHRAGRDQRNHARLDQDRLHLQF